MDSTLAFNPADLPEEPIFEIHTTEGTITVLLYADTPLHRDNFIKLASQHYYDSVLFHRVIYNFMIQTGDPNTKDPSKEDEYGNGGPDYTIPAEIIPAHTHKKERWRQPVWAIQPIPAGNPPARSSTSYRARKAAAISMAHIPSSARLWTDLT